MTIAPAERSKLNGICPYFTMFPLSFPHSVIAEQGEVGGLVLDPFCGRGTTLYAARLLGWESAGIDSSTVAAAISEAKLANAATVEIAEEAELIFHESDAETEVPSGEFWELAYDPGVLRTLCRFRQALLQDCTSETRKALRAVVLGALHGPRSKSTTSYFSNQSQRTYAPKPRYAVAYWRKHGLRPSAVDVLQIIRTRAERYYGEEHTLGSGRVVLGDSRDPITFEVFGKAATWVITSPPYYGLRTYIPDQWLRLWFLGGPAEVQYTSPEQVQHSSPGAFAADLRSVWLNTANVCAAGAQLVVRFGGIHDRRADPTEILLNSLEGTPWRLVRVEPAGSASGGRRQALHIHADVKAAKEEYDFWAILED